jgi:hypothetical protein
LALSVPHSRFASRVGGGSAFYVRRMTKRIGILLLALAMIAGVTALELLRRNFIILWPPPPKAVFVWSPPPDAEGLAIAATYFAAATILFGALSFVLLFRSRAHWTICSIGLLSVLFGAYCYWPVHHYVRDHRKFVEEMVSQIEDSLEKHKREWNAEHPEDVKEEQSEATPSGD